MGRYHGIPWPILSVLEGNVLKACTREVRVFRCQMCTSKGTIFQRICVKEGYFCKFSVLRASFPLMSNILDFGNDVNLHKRLQSIMLSSSCTTCRKGMLFEDPCTREGMEFGLKYVLMRIRVSHPRTNRGIPFPGEYPPPRGVAL